MEVITEGLAVPIKRRSNKRTAQRRRTSKKVGLGVLPFELLEKIFVQLDPKSAVAASVVCNRFTKICTPRFWKNLLHLYWHLQLDFSKTVSERLSLYLTVPAPQIHFMSNRSFSVSFQDIQDYAMALATSEIMPIGGANFLGITLPDVPVRNNLARFYPNRQFYFASYNTRDSRFCFKTLLASARKTPPTAVGPKSPRSRSRAPKISREMFPVGLKAMADQSSFLQNFIGASVGGTPGAMLLAQCVTSVIMATQVSGSQGRLTVRIPGVMTLPPPEDISKFYVRSTIMISKIPSIALEFKFDNGALTDLLMHGPGVPWTYVD